MKTFFTYILILFTLITVGQTNLVPNPSFEDIDSCYGNFSPLGFDVFQWSGCTGWYNPTYASSDLWCENPVAGTSNPPSVAGVGYQVPKTGENYAGMIILDVGDWQYREYIQCELLSPLEENNVYAVSFYVNTASNFNNTSSIGAYFSTNQISNFSSFLFLPVQPQVENTSGFITDTLGWTLITGIYKATGGEKFMTIGSFDDYFNIQLTDYDSLNAGGIYFFIEDVEVIESPSSFFIPNVFSPNEDNINDGFSPNVSNINDWECLIYNRWGQKIYTLNDGVNNWNGRTTSGNKVPEGTYYYVFTASIDGEEISEKGFIELLR